MGAILVADDMAICREPLVAALRLEGYEVIGASNGKDALKVIRSSQPALVVLDVNMPEMDAWAVLRVLRGDRQYHNLPVILLTGTVDRPMILQAREFGVGDFVLKDRFLLPQMISRIEKHVGKAPGSASAKASAPAGAVSGPTSHPPDRQAAPMLLTLAQDNRPGRAAPRAAVPQRAPLWPTRQSPKSAAVPQRAAIALTIPQLLSREQTIARIEKCTQAKTLAGAVAEVVSLASSSRGSLGDLAVVLRRDPVLATRVLQVANSAAYMIQKGRVTTLDDAVRYIGLSTIRNIALSVGVFGAFAGGTAADGLNLVRCWQHSFAVALILGRLVPASESLTPGMVHLVGLCHELGEIALRQHFTEEYSAAISLASQTGKPLQQVQSMVLGVSQEELVSLVLSRLGLPSTIISPIYEFFQAENSATTGELSLLASALKLANSYAHGLLLVSSPEATVGPMLQAEYKRIVPDGVALRIDNASLRGEAITTTNLLARLSAADEAKLVRPLFASSAMRIWYVRHRTLTAMDPLGAALGFLADAQEHDELPQRPEDLANCQAIVAVAARAGVEPLGSAEFERVRRMPGGSVPILYLAALGDGSPYAAMHVEFGRYPVALSTLKAFVGKVQQQAAGEHKGVCK